MPDSFLLVNKNRPLFKVFQKKAPPRGRAENEERAVESGSLFVVGPSEFPLTEYLVHDPMAPFGVRQILRQHRPQPVAGPAQPSSEQDAPWCIL
jgi:hypothetical protein